MSSRSPPARDHRAWDRRSPDRRNSPKSSSVPTTWGDDVHSLPVNEWIDWLGGLHGPVRIELAARNRPSLRGSRVLLSAEFAPFDDLIEIVLLSDSGEERVLLDDPRDLRVDSNPPEGQWHARVDTRTDSISLCAASTGQHPNSRTAATPFPTTHGDQRRGVPASSRVRGPRRCTGAPSHVLATLPR
jgi:hypothetical protein